LATTNLPELCHSTFTSSLSSNAGIGHDFPLPAMAKLAMQGNGTSLTTSREATR
jgi:hypothetical protein